MPIPLLGFDQRFAPANQLLMDPDDPRYAGMDAGSRLQALKNLATVMPQGQPTPANYSPQFNSGPALVSAPLLNGPQQSYTTASNLRGSGDGQSGQAGRMESSYNNSPYQAPQGTVSNTGQPAGPPQAGSQGELTGQAGQGWNIYQTTPTWTGSPLSQSPPARDEGDFKAPPISGPNPIQQRQQMLRQQLIAQAFQNMPRGYKFKLG